jgi:hypothetical protein
MEKWGADLYGDPCRDCGFSWVLTPAEAVFSVRSMPDAFAKRLTDATGQERHPDLTWTTAAYVSHVTDNLRIWAERLAGGYLAGVSDVPGYDPTFYPRHVTTTRSLWQARCGHCGGPSMAGRSPWKLPLPLRWCCTTPLGAHSEPKTWHETTPTTHTTTCGTSTASSPPSKHVLMCRCPCGHAEWRTLHVSIADVRQITWECCRLPFALIIEA